MTTATAISRPVSLSSALKMAVLDRVHMACIDHEDPERYLGDLMDFQDEGPMLSLLEDADWSDMSKAALFRDQPASMHVLRDHITVSLHEVKQKGVAIVFWDDNPWISVIEGRGVVIH